MTAAVVPAGSYDVIVVGGGHNGLVAGFYMSRAGYRVLILERRERVGGLCAPIEFFPGYRGTITNTPSALDPKVAADMELASFGLTYARPDPTVIVPFADGTAFRGWRGAKATRQEVSRFSTKDADAYFTVTGLFDRLARQLRVSVYEPPPRLRELVSRLETREDEQLFAEIMFGTTTEFLDSRLDSWQIKTLLSSLAVSSGNVAPSIPGSAIGLLRRPLSTASLDEGVADDSRNHVVRGSTGLPRGGMGSIAEAMEQAARAAGCTILTDSEVSAITTSTAGVVSGIALNDGREFGATTVLSNLHPRTTLLKLADPQLLPSEVIRTLEGKRIHGAAFKVVLAMDGIPRHASATTEAEALQYASCQFRYSPSLQYLEDAYTDFREGRPSARPKLLGLTPSVVDDTIAPKGRHLMSVNVWYAPYHLAEGYWDGERTQTYGRTVIDTIAEFIPNIKDIIIDSRFYSPLDFEREWGLLEGHQTHGDQTPFGMFSMRPSVYLSDYRTPIPGLYLCGSAMWPGGTVTGVPGHNAAHAALQDFRVGSELSQQLDAPAAG
jgi:phytoene dehydrogenase-like protein